MVVYRLAIFLLFLLAGASAGLGQLPSGEKEIFVDSYEGIGLQVNRLVLDGKLDADRPASFEISKRNAFWDIKFSEGAAQATTIIIPVRNYSPLHFSKVVVINRSRSRNERAVMVIIPFGEPLTSCFLNGDSVFRHILLMYNSGKLVSKEERTFDGCKQEYRPLRLNPANPN